MYICSQNLLSVSLSEYSVIKRNFNGNRSVPCKLMLNSEYSVIKSDVIKSFDCTFSLFEQTKRKNVLRLFFIFCSQGIYIYFKILHEDIS